MREAYTEEMKLEREINKKKRIPREVREKTNKEVFRNLLFAIGVILYLILLNLGFWKLDQEIYVKDTAIYSIASLAVTIILFEKAFKTEKGNYAISGIEILTASIFTYFVPYTYFHTSEITRKLWMLLPLAYAIYYTAKSIIICIKSKDWRKSDVKEIIYEEETKREDITAIDKDKEAEVRAKILEEIKSKEKDEVSVEEPIKAEPTITRRKTTTTRATTTSTTKPKTAARRRTSTEPKEEKKTTRTKTTRKSTTKAKSTKDKQEVPKTKTRKKKVEE